MPISANPKSGIENERHMLLCNTTLASAGLHLTVSVFVNLQEQESAQASEQHCVQLEKARRELERQLSGLSDRLEEEEACSAQLALHRDRLEAECGSLRRDLDELEGALTVAEKEKQVEHHLIFTTE